MEQSGNGNREFDPLIYFRELDSDDIGRRIWVLRELHSTNKWIKTIPSRTTHHGLLCLADSQIRGRGQYNRSWLSEKNKNLTFTIVLKPEYSTKIQLLLLGMACAVSDAVKKMLNLDIRLKWPNDLMAGEKKIGGILGEASFAGDHIERFLIGTGINVNMYEIPEYIGNIAESLINLHGSEVPREKLMATVMNEFKEIADLWETDTKALIKKVNDILIHYGCWSDIIVDGVKQSHKHKILGVNENGWLMTLNHEDSIELYSYQQVRII